MHVDRNYLLIVIFIPTTDHKIGKQCPGTVKFADLPPPQLFSHRLWSTLPVYYNASAYSVEMLMMINKWQWQNT